MAFGQVVIGPPGSGKTEYSHTMHRVLNELGRKTVVVNLDPANEHLSYECAVNLADLIRLEDAMDSFGLGPNGGIVYCMEYLLANVDWLLEQLAPYRDDYLIFDFPGQVELYSHHTAVKDLLHHLNKDGHRLCVVQLVDAHHCTDVAKYISVVLFALQSMFQLELPQVNVLSKVDLTTAYGHLNRRLGYYADAQDLASLAEDLDRDPRLRRFARLNHALGDVLDDYSMVNFVPLAVNDPTCVHAVLAIVDKAVGYAYGPVAGDIDVAAAVQDAIDKYDAEFAARRGAEEVYGGEGYGAQPDEDLDEDAFDRWDRVQREVMAAAAAGGDDGEESSAPPRAPAVQINDIVERSG
ncbi:hypothetical protein H9P43_008252 [Blastocladiella emersonii ATCC 22665]|nr:hypothetical protein H9P43_008252 [Blastocladiella emersonii ATCC 22665]